MASEEPGLSPAKAALLARWRSGNVRLPDLNRLVPGPPTRLAACSFEQQFLWECQQEYPNLPLFTIAYCARFDAPVDVEAFRASSRDLSMRHETLRTRIEPTRPAAQQNIHPAPLFDPEYIDLRHLGEARAEQAAVAHAEGLLRRPYDVVREPLVRSALYQVGDKAHMLSIVVHHLVADGWSLGIALSELNELYQARIVGTGPQLDPLPAQYRDFAHWEQGWLSREDWRPDLDYWRDRLADLPAPRLPWDREPAERDFRCAAREFTLTAEQSAKLRDFSVGEGVSLFMTMLACLQVLLARTTDLDDIAVGVPMLNRRHHETQGLVGYFTNTVVVRASMSGGSSFRDVLARVRDAVLAAAAHQALPLPLYLREVAPDRDPIMEPLYRALYVLQPPLPQAELAGATLHPHELDPGVSIYDLALHMWDAEGLYGKFEYAVDIFDSATVDWLVDAYFGVAEQVMADPAICVADLQVRR